MELIVVYRTKDGVGRLPITVDKKEINFDDFEDIEREVGEELFTKGKIPTNKLIITNIIKLPIKL